MFYLIYKLTNIKNNKFYVGITSESLQHRFRGHVRKSRHKPTSNLHKALRKYGEDSFTKEVLHSFETSSKKCAYKIEQEYITKTRAVSLGYNMDIGYGWACADKSGSNNPMFGKTSGNAHSVFIQGIEYPSISLAASTLNINCATIARWIKCHRKPECYKV